MMGRETKGVTTPKRGPFTMVIERDRDSGWLVGELVELPSCYTQAPDVASLEVNMREVIELYLETVDGAEPESTFVGTLRIDVAI